jgi:hypothetical protein
MAVMPSRRNEKMGFNPFLYTIPVVLAFNPFLYTIPVVIAFNPFLYTIPVVLPFISHPQTPQTPPKSKDDDNAIYRFSA